MIAGVLFAPTLSASTISVGYLQVLADSPTPGEQELTINDLTGVNWSADYTACSNLNFTDWNLTVTHSSTYYNGTGPALAAPYVVTSGAAGDITPRLHQ